MYGFRCSECGEAMNEEDYFQLSGDPRYDDADVYIIHSRCVRADVTVLATHGELALVRWATNGS